MSHVLVSREVVETRTKTRAVIVCDGCGREEPAAGMSNQDERYGHQPWPYDWFFLCCDYNPGSETRRIVHACSLECARKALELLPTKPRSFGTYHEKADSLPSPLPPAEGKA
jgi:hypothetical protein